MKLNKSNLLKVGIILLALTIAFFLIRFKKDKQHNVGENLNVLKATQEKYIKLDSLNHEKSKIPYSRSDSARDAFWR